MTSHTGDALDISDCSMFSNGFQCGGNISFNGTMYEDGGKSTWAVERCEPCQLDADSDSPSELLFIPL